MEGLAYLKLSLLVDQRNDVGSIFDQRAIMQLALPSFSSALRSVVFARRDLAHHLAEGSRQLPQFIAPSSHHLQFARGFITLLAHMLGRQRQAANRLSQPARHDPNHDDQENHRQARYRHRPDRQLAGRTSDLHFGHTHRHFPSGERRFGPVNAPRHAFLHMPRKTGIARCDLIAGRNSPDVSPGESFGSWTAPRWDAP